MRQFQTYLGRRMPWAIPSRSSSCPSQFLLNRQAFFPPPPTSHRYGIKRKRSLVPPRCHVGNLNIFKVWASIGSHRSTFPFTTSTYLTVLSTEFMRSAVHTTDFMLSVSRDLPISLFVLSGLLPSLWSTQSCGILMNIPSGLSHPNYVSGVLSGIPWISDLNLWKLLPCNDLVKWSANIFPSRQYFTSRSPIVIWYLIKKIWRVCDFRIPTQ